MKSLLAIFCLPSEEMKHINELQNEKMLLFQLSGEL